MLTRAHIDPLLEADSSGPVSITMYILLELNLQTRLGPIGGHLATFVPQYRGEFRHGQSRVGTDLCLEWAAAVLKRRRPVSGEQRDRARPPSGCANKKQKDNGSGGRVGTRSMRELLCQ